VHLHDHAANAWVRVIGEVPEVGLPGTNGEHDGKHEHPSKVAGVYP
jgi:hypothetical protein